MNKRKTVKDYVIRYLWLFLIGIAADIIVDFFQTFVPEFLGQIVEIVSTHDHVVFADIAMVVRNLLIIATILSAGRALMRFTLMRASQLTEASIRHDMFRKAERLSQRYYHENKIGTIMSWFSSDVEAVEEFTGWGVIMGVDALFLTGVSLFKMIRLDPIMSVLALLPMFGLIIWGNKVEKIMSDKWEERQKQFDRLYDFTQETFSGIRVIKAFVKEKQELHTFSKIAKENADKNLEFAHLSISFDVCIEAIIGVTITLLMGFGSYFVYLTSIGSSFMMFGHVIELSAGMLVTFIGYVDTLIWPMIAIGQILQMHSRFKASTKRIYAFLDQEEEISDKEDAIELADCKGKITFDHFSFAYPGSTEHSLKDVSFEIKAGEMVGIVGKIGSGKSTLVNSLLHLYNIDGGTIYIDDVDLMDIKIASLRENIAYVPQDNFLFSDNIRNNISFANSKASMNDIRNAAKFADVDDNILGFSDGYETLTGERGVTLSGGQKQRISIARAYIKDAPIMIMDDSVSAVDVKTEETILHNIYENRKGKTTIIIASRVSTVAHLDKILVLKEGEVEAFDTPERLEKISPTYAKMVYLQKLESEL
ncbi:MAG: ABC transporter ATP-binding protein/permease [Erysipelotrichaceae bacterium]|nr:ABC transporter ATP-binding protein/permease [Erysipelotrichaceae bacterium]